MSKVEVNNDGPIKTITLNRPEKRNALDQEMLDSLYEIFSEKVSVDARAIVLRGNGPSFCAGIDLAERQRQPSTGAISPVEKVFHAMEMNPLPIVSIVQGAAIAGGCEMALHSEFVVAAETAKFGMSLAQIGLAPSWFLTKKLLEVAGPVNTREILLLGDPLPSSWMLNKGIISRVAPDAHLEQEASKIIRRLAINAPLSLKAMKALIIRELAFRDGIAHDMFEKVGVYQQKASRKYIKILKPIKILENDACIELSPAKNFSIDFEIDFDSEAIKDTSFNISLVNGAFNHEISSARTFGFLEDVDRMRMAGLGLGGSLKNVVVVDGSKVLNDDGLRFKDEFVRHKILDCVGDLYLCGGPIIGSVKAYKTGHYFNNKLLRKLFSEKSSWKWASHEADHVFFEDQPKMAIA